MKKGCNQFTTNKFTKFRRPPQVKSSKAQILTKFHKIPKIQFEDQQLTSFSGIVIFQLLFKNFNLKNKLKKCFNHICKRLEANQVFTLASMMAHNFSREMQMVAHPAASKAKAKRPAAWTFQKLETIRRQIIQRAGRLIRPQGKLTLTMSPNTAVKQDLLFLMDALQKAA